MFTGKWYAMVVLTCLQVKTTIENNMKEAQGNSTGREVGQKFGDCIDDTTVTALVKRVK